MCCYDTVAFDDLDNMLKDEVSDSDGWAIQVHRSQVAGLIDFCPRSRQWTGGI